MDIDIKYIRIQKIVEKELTCSAHNLDHVYRVYRLCKYLAQYEENVNVDVLLISALLHDIARVKESNDNTGEIDHAVLGSQMAAEILKNLGYEDEFIGKIKRCIKAHRFRTGNKPETIEEKILFDSDKLDAIGAIGIARTFMLSGQFGQSLSIDKPSNNYMKENTAGNGRLKDVSKHTPFIEYEFKFKKIPNQLYTKKGKEIGEKRLKYMEEYFNKLKNEINGLE